MLNSNPVLLLAGAAALALSCSPASAGNIITFDDNANTCGGAVICSTNGTTGYLNNGTGEAFDLNTITKWFQIDAESPPNNLLPGTQTEGEPDKGAGGFLVVNDTGRTVTTFSLTLTDFVPPPSAQFQAQHGTGAPRGREWLRASRIAAPQSKAAYLARDAGAGCSVIDTRRDGNRPRNWPTGSSFGTSAKTANATCACSTTMRRRWIGKKPRCSAWSH